MAARKVAGSAAAVAAATLATEEPVVECREVSGGDSLYGSWLDLGLADVDAGAQALVPALRASDEAAAALAPAAAKRALAMGMDLARDPAVQRAIADRCGVDVAPAPAVEAGASETDALRRMVRSLTAEKADLVSRLTRTEKINLILVADTGFLPRLNLKEFGFYSTCAHGWSFAGGPTA